MNTSHTHSESQQDLKILLWQYHMPLSTFLAPLSLKTQYHPKCISPTADLYTNLSFFEKLSHCPIPPHQRLVQHYFHVRFFLYV